MPGANADETRGTENLPPRPGRGKRRALSAQWKRREEKSKRKMPGGGAAAAARSCEHPPHRVMPFDSAARGAQRQTLAERQPRRPMGCRRQLLLALAQRLARGNH